MSIQRQEQLGSIIAGCGIVYAVDVATQGLTSFSNLVLPLIPVEICAAGIVIWLAAKWRRTVNMNR